MIQIICPVDSFKHYEKPIIEFQKRLGKKVKLIKIKPSKKKEETEVKKEETERLKQILEKTKGYKVLLCIDGNSLNSIEFERFLSEKQMNFSDITFVIGGAFGVDFEKIQDLIDYKFSFSKMTFPHSLALLTLYEQLYRAESIKTGKKYHK
ncbi:23S rRNA (pseudouridine(1915)-N(3))-methyltransferase RlmH [Candidatus Gracilibacteria bacterium]|nr:MAG: 23S rRNA (pseudouridine(1915)-N(3))-methyltransferase RlmH [Candidatus Gracilibacteria bacterium]